MTNGAGNQLHTNGVTDKREEQKPGTGPKSPPSTTAQGVQNDDITKQTW